MSDRFRLELSLEGDVVSGSDQSDSVCRPEQDAERVCLAQRITPPSSRPRGASDHQLFNKLDPS